jgi:hypothetical protein
VRIGVLDGAAQGGNMTYTISLVDTISVVAALMVLISFYWPVRPILTTAAISCNLAFVAFGFYLDLPPVWLLHIGLIGLHLLRFDLGGGHGTYFNRLG